MNKMLYVNEEAKEVILSSDDKKKLDAAGLILYDIGRELILSNHNLKGIDPKCNYNGFNLMSMGLSLVELIDNEKLIIYNKEK